MINKYKEKLYVHKLGVKTFISTKPRNMCTIEMCVTCASTFEDCITIFETGKNNNTHHTYDRCKPCSKAIIKRRETRTKSFLKMINVLI